jgi:hypothetical protein
MHQTETEQTAMDETTKTKHRTITAIIIALTISACTTTQQTPPPEPEPITHTYADQYGPVAHALNELNNHLQTITTTTTTVLQQNRNAATPKPFDPSMWDTLAFCESGGRWDYPPVKGGYSGGLMFHIGTWRAMGGTEYAPDAYLATREQQIDIAERTKAAAGGSMRPWPGCARKHGWN